MWLGFSVTPRALSGGSNAVSRRVAWPPWAGTGATLWADHVWRPPGFNELGKMIPETMTTRCPSWVRKRHRSLMTRRPSGLCMSGNSSWFCAAAISQRIGRRAKKRTGLGPHLPQAKSLRNARKSCLCMALCQEFWILHLGFSIGFLAHDPRGLFCDSLPAPQVCNSIFPFRPRFFSGTGVDLLPVAPFHTPFHPTRRHFFRGFR